MLWTRTARYAKAIIFKQGGVCPVTALPFEYDSSANIDHRFPLYRVRRDMGDRPWFLLLPYWGLGNLQAIHYKAHDEKSAEEAAERAAWKK
jgi:hypothetical protein